MSRPVTQIRAVLVCLLQLVLANIIQCQCNTDQNPYCAGQSQFEQLCCTYPSVCYWSNRDGTPACCPAGTDCRGNGGPAPDFVAFTNVQQTTYYVETVYTSTQPQYSTVTYYVSDQPTTTYVAPQFTSLTTVVTPAVVVVTDTQAVVAPVTTDGVYVTVTQVQVVAAASRFRSEHEMLCKTVGAFFLVLGVVFLV